eukprot:scaffold83345_cov69-Phaeocystis_antarctica.AAC.1
MVLRLLLRIWSGCGALLNGAAVADTKPCRGGDAPYRALSRSTASTLRRVAWRSCCCANWTRPALQCFPVPVCGLLLVVQATFGRVVVILCGSAAKGDAV